MSAERNIWKITIPDHLILPFGTQRQGDNARLKDLSPIKLTAAAANGVYLRSDMPVVYVDKRLKKPLTLFEYGEVFRDDGTEEIDGRDIAASLNYIKNCTASFMKQPTEYELMFLDYYFKYIAECVERSRTAVHREPLRAFNALLPIPEMQLYVVDPLKDSWQLEPDQNFRVDFGFWTGTQLLAIEIDGAEPEGYARDVRRDRMLRRAKVDVIHILNLELKKYGSRVIRNLLPPELLIDWQNKAPQSNFNPVEGIPF